MTEWINVSDVTPRIAYTATSLQTAFTVPFVFFSNSDLSVYKNGTLLTLSTHYTVTGAEVETGGTVTLLTGATVGDSIQIVRRVPVEQTTHIPPSGPLDIPAINIQISKLIAIDQQNVDAINRTVRLADSVVLPGGLVGTVPVASEFLKWNANADGVESAAVVAPAGSYAIATQSEAEAGALNNVLMTPLRVAQEIAARATVAYDTRAAAVAAVVPAAAQGLRTFGYATISDGGAAEYFRVASEPATAAKFRSTDRYLPNGTIDNTNGGWWQMVISGLQDVRKFGVQPGIDCSTTLQDAVTAANVLIPPAASNYVLTGNIQIPSNRHIWVQKGATIINTGGRFTAFLPGGGNVHFQNDGVMGFLSTATSPQLGDWPANNGGLWPERGEIEMGGTVASPAGNLKVTGNGRVYSDYVFTTVAATGLTNTTFQLNRKGIAFFNCHDVVCDGQEVDHIHGEAIYCWGGSAESTYNVRFTNNNVHHVAFNGPNFNTFTAFEQMLIAHNRVSNCFQGIEASTGTADGNHVANCVSGIVFGGGGGAAKIKIINNTVYVSSGVAYSLEFDPAAPAVQVVTVAGNHSYFAGTTAFQLSKIDGFILKGNISYAHANIAAGYSFHTTSTATSGHIEGNVTRSPGAFSSGNVLDSGGNTVGTNPVY